MMPIVEERLAALRSRLELLEHIDWDGNDDVFDDDKVFVAEVKAALVRRELTLDELAGMRKPHKDRAQAILNEHMERVRQQYTAGPHNKLFAVANKSQMRVDVIAMDVQTAADFAVRANHVRSAENATVSRYNDSFIQTLTTNGSALGRAVREGLPGVVEKRGNNVVIGDRVFTPMSVV